MPLIPPEHNEDDFIHIWIKKSESEAFLAYHWFIESHLEKRNPLPKRVFEKYTSFFNFPKVELEEYYQKLTNDVIEKTINHFKSARGYNFEGKRTEKEINEDIPNAVSFEPIGFEYPTYSFSQMIYEVCNILVGQKNITQKKECLISSYELIEQYLKKWLTEIEYKEYELYSKIVISGYITLMFFGKLNKAVNTETINTFTGKSINEEIYYAVRYTIEAHIERQESENKIQSVLKKERRKK